MKKMLLIMGVLILVAAVLVMLAGMYKFNYLANQPRYDVEGNKITETDAADPKDKIENIDENEERVQDETLSNPPTTQSESKGAQSQDETNTQPPQAQELPPQVVFIGLTLQEAQALAETESILFRVGEIDGQLQPVTFDYRPGRVTASVQDGTVVDVSIE